MAYKIDIKLNTVSTYKSKLFEKLQIKNVVDLINLSQLHNLFGS
ncbi:MAG: LuxR C-terminal-related transcriptional regulator [Bacteroidia bacterium]